jgi:hypothetical protein
MPRDEITIRKIKRNIDDSTFLEIYKKLLINGQDLSNDEKFYLLKIALIFLNAKDENVERLGYGIILRYSNQFRDYRPLYDVALNRDYVPITKFIENFNDRAPVETFSSLLLTAYQENFKIAGDSNNIYRSRGQMILNRFAATKDNIAIVAPTSYGKSEMLIHKVEDNLTKKICVVVPSKALLAQMKRNLFKNDQIKNAFRKIVTHPDMFRGTEQSFLAVLTQERLLRLLQRNKSLSLDLVLVDEAHNLLENNERAHLLAQVLLILHKRNPLFLFNFFTPFLVNANNLSITNYDVDIKQKAIKENLKIERFYTYDLSTKKIYIYDQFVGRCFLIKTDDFQEDIEFVSKYGSSKNIVYLNRPTKAEEVALKMADLSSPIELTSEVQKVIDSIADLIHPSYDLIKCIRSGVIYHHGGIPDVVRLYIEDVYSRYSEFKFIVTTSTLLEGVNIPAETIFLLTPLKGRGYLSASQFKNLIGRVCRFRDIFDKEKGDLKMLEPKIYLIKGKYVKSNFSLESFLKGKVNAGISIEDNVQNPLLKNSINREEAHTALEYLENMEPGASGLPTNIEPRSTIGRLCFENSVHDFDIIVNEEILTTNLENYIGKSPDKINSPKSLVNSIAKIFFEGITLREESENIARLKDNDKARLFYELFISWRCEGAPYPRMIKSFLKYWKGEVEKGGGLIYVGSKWGEQTRDGGWAPLWVNMVEKTEVQRVNLAIAKIKEEQEFVDFNILKYVEILNTLTLLDADFYDQVKYGTPNKNIICLLKNGFSIELAKLLISKYIEFLRLDLVSDSVSYEQRLIDTMQANNENDILIFEAKANL